MTTLFKHVLEGMTENNENNDGKFSDWDSAHHAIETYGDNFGGDCDEAEMAATVDALTAIIDSNGEKLDEAVTLWNLAVWGSNFTDNSGSVPFGG